MAMLRALLLLVSLSQTYGHGKFQIITFMCQLITQSYLGMMYFPVPWWNTLGNGQTFGERPDPNWDFRHEGHEVWQPDEVCEGPTSGEDRVCSSCAQTTCATFWFTNHTYIPGQPTLVGSQCKVKEFRIWINSKFQYYLPS